jgi:hypothetical protein
MFFKIAEFDYFDSEFNVKIFIYRNIYNLNSSKINNIACNKKKLKSCCIFKFISYNEIGNDGAEKIGEGVS